jgi:hypothetical protein
LNFNAARKATVARRRAQGTVVLATALVVLTACTLAQAGSAPSVVENAGLGDADGYIAAGDALSPFDTVHPAITNLDTELREAVQQAAKDAQRAGVPMKITAGWRSERYQQALLDDAIRSYGSEEEARKWVNTPEKSTHVTGEAVDIGPTTADSWLEQHGSEYGLCRVYANEMWHFELLVTPGHRCPRTISDASAG